MNISIRYPSGQYITVKVEKDDTILTLKEKICLLNILFVSEQFNLHFPGQEQPLYNELSILSLPNTPFLQLIPDTLDVSKLTYDAYSCIQRNVTPNPSFDSLSVEELVRSNSMSSLRIYTSSGIAQTTQCLSTSPEKPIVPPAPKAIIRKNVIKYVDSCVIG